MNLILLLFALVFVAACGPSPDASAACSGSGLTWACAAGTTIAEVNTALTSATDGATLTFAVGSYTWDSSFIALQNTKGVTLICAVEHGCDVSPGTNGFLRHQTLNGVNTKFYRFSGFYVHGGTCSLNCIHFFPVFGASADTEMTQFRIDHNRFEDLANGGQLMTFGEITRPSKWSGSIDHNLITNSTGSNRFQFFGTVDSSTVTPEMSQIGSGSCVYFENNTVNYTNPTNNGLAWIDGQATACYIIRDNSLTNARVVSHGTVFNWGIARMEVYRNTFVRDKSTSDGLGDCYRSIHMQGSGTGVVWGNTFSCFLTMSPDTIQLLHYRDATPADAGYSAGIGQCDGLSANDGNTSPEATHRGYPCRHQPGRAARLGVPLWGVLMPMATFRNVNLADNSKVDMVFDCSWAGTEYCSEHVQENRDYYNAVSATDQTTSSSPFDGTVGIGHGTIANRPGSCTHTTSPDGDEGGGVMYWATDQEVLYRCSATNTWTVYYTAYTYPHPLQASGGGSGGMDIGSLGTSQMLARQEPR